MTHNTKSTINIVALVVLSLAEGAAVVLSHFGHAWWGLGLVAVVALGLVMWYLTHRDKGHEWGLSLAVIATKLLSNTIMPTRTGVLYLLAFILHISWLPDCILSIAQNGSPVSDSFCLLLIVIMGIFILTIYCPNSRKVKSRQARKVLVSGMSVIGEKTPLPKTDGELESFNLYPLVRMLQLTDDANDGCEMMILLSNSFFSDSTTTANRLKTFISAIDAERGKAVTQEVSVEELLRVLIKAVAMRVFPEKQWIADKLEIWFSKPCDYNDFEQCYHALNSHVNNKDDSGHQLLLNLSPGTGIVSALITLLAVDGDRSLYYYSQDRNLPAGERLTEVNKNDIPLQSLLSQALESFDF